MSANHKSDYLIIGGSYEGAKRSNITNITYITIRLMFEEKIDLKVNEKKNRKLCNSLFIYYR